MYINTSEGTLELNSFQDEMTAMPWKMLRFTILRRARSTFHNACRSRLLVTYLLTYLLSVQNEQS